MENGFEIFWTNHALEELLSTTHYLETNFPEEVLFRLAHKIEKTTFLIAHNPYIFPESEVKKGVRKAVVEKYNTLYYRIGKNNRIEILSFFSNRQSPARRKL
jgi:plasmid stabilization system protein ParE